MCSPAVVTAETLTSRAVVSEASRAARLPCSSSPITSAA